MTPQKLMPSNGPIYEKKRQNSNVRNYCIMKNEYLLVVLVAQVVLHPTFMINKDIELNENFAVHTDLQIIF